MKLPFIVLCLLLVVPSTTFSQALGQLHLEGNRLKGTCEHRYLTGFEMELDSTYTEIDSALLFRQLPRTGSINFKNRGNIPTEFTLTNRAGFAQIMFRFRTSYLTFDHLQIEKQSITFRVDDDPKVPVTEEDLRMIVIAKKMLSEEKYWHKEDDRNCDDDLANKSFSIYCALRMASLEVEEKYNHRNAVLQKLRHLIEEKFPNKKWKHRLMDFNNMPEVTFADVQEMLAKIETEIIQELKDNKTE